jgi:hypothetical protein
MPTATSFTALGAGNGFPFCVPKNDVSGYDNWITLGGTAKGSAPTDSEIALSLTNAMELWWNYYSATGSFSASFSVSSNNQNASGSVTHTNKEVIIKRDGEADALEPVNRSCKGTHPSYTLRRDSLSTQFSDEDSISNYFAGGSIVAGNTFQFIRKMYNGPTSDESNFVGYGASRLCISSADAFTEALTSYAVVEISVGSFLNGEDYFSSNVSDGSVRESSDIKVFQTNLNGIPFRSKTTCVAGGALLSNNNTYSVSASELSGTAEANQAFYHWDYSSEASASISSLSFWTY